ncbi:hypothetical protein RCL1_004943 [Eukaryota sp. TZLM3-RCL]
MNLDQALRRRFRSLRIADKKSLKELDKTIKSEVPRYDQQIEKLQSEMNLTQFVHMQLSLLVVTLLFLYKYHSHYWIAPIVSLGFCLISESLTRFSPLSLIGRLLGFRTSSEIHTLIVALQVLRGDFIGLENKPTGDILGVTATLKD